MNEEQFEEYWYKNKKRLLNENAEYVRATEGIKLSSGADWLLYGLPVVVGIAFMEQGFVSNELANYALSAVITIACFMLCVFIKSLITNTPSLTDIEKKTKQELYEKLVSAQQKPQNDAENK